MIYKIKYLIDTLIFRFNRLKEFFTTPKGKVMFTPIAITILTGVMILVNLKQLNLSVIVHLICLLLLITGLSNEKIKLIKQRDSLFDIKVSLESQIRVEQEFREGYSQSYNRLLAEKLALERESESTIYQLKRRITEVEESSDKYVGNSVITKYNPEDFQENTWDRENLN